MIILKTFGLTTQTSLSGRKKNLIYFVWILDFEFHQFVFFSSSIGSLDLKARYLQQRAFAFGKPKNLPAYFATSYSSVIRPRCEAAIKL